MVDIAPQSPIEDALLDELETLLDSESLQECMRLDEIQGYLCAALAGPEAINVSDRLADIFGDESLISSPEGRKATEIINLLAESLEQTMAAGEAPVLLLYPKNDTEDSPSDYSPWCQGYLAGVDQSNVDWFEFIENSNNDDAEDEISFLDERLFPMMVLTGEAEAAATEHGEQWPAGEEKAELEEESESNVGQAAADIYRFWLAKRKSGATRVKEATPGRNEPCPCGSGKKFKQCCL